MAEWMPKSARPYRPASAKPEVSGAESFARGAYQGAGMGFADEQAGALEALGGHLKRTFSNDWKRTGGGWLEDIKAELGQVTDDYQQGRDESRRNYAEAEQANPTAYGVGQFGGAVATGIATGGASSLGKAGLKGALTAGALEGGASGLGNSEADLTKQDMGAYARAFTDTLGGAAVGAPLAGVGYGVAKGVKALGGKAVDALRRARGELTEGIAAERSLADDAARAVEEKEAGRLVKDEYAARQQNARVDRQAALAKAKAAREAARAERAPAPRGGNRAPPPTPEEFQFTDDQIAGFERQARGAVAERLNKGRGFRQDLENPELTSRRKGFAQDYLDNYDVSDPAAAMQAELRQNIAINLGKRGYSAEDIQRIVNRYAPDVEPAPRAAPPEAENPALLRQRERGFGAQNMGAARYGEETIAYPNADIRRSQTPSGDPFHDAPTKVGLIETSPDGGYPGEGRNVMRDFEFRDPRSGRDVKMSTHRSPNYETDVSVDGIGFKDQVDEGLTYEEQWGAGANKVGPRVMREVLADLRRAYPGAERVGGQRVTGATPGRNASLPLPEVTQAQSRSAIRGANPPGEFEQALVERNREALPASARRAAQEWETAPQTQVDGLPEIPRGMRRLYRGDAYRGTANPSLSAQGSLNAEDLAKAEGRWFTDRAGVAREYARSAAEATDGTPIAKYMDVPEGEARQFRADGLPEGRFANEAFREWLPPRSMARDAEIMDLPRDIPLGQEDGMNANVPFWDRGIGDDVFLSPDRVRGDDLTQRINFDPEVTQRMDLGDAVKQGRGDIARMGGGGSAWDGYGPEGRTIHEFFPGGADPSREAPVSMDDLRDWTGAPPEPRYAPEALPDVEELTQPGRPSFPGDARTAQPFAPRPQLRDAYQPRRAMDSGPTQNLRAPAPKAVASPRPEPVYDPEASMNAPRDFDAETYAPQGAAMPPRPMRASSGAPELPPEPVQPLPMRQTRPRPLAPPMAPPSQTVMGAPPGSLVRQARPSVEELAQQREAGALAGVARAGWEGARGANNALAAPFGAAVGIGKEALENPAVRARAITAFRLDRLARVRPEVWARVGPTLQRALQAGPERFKAERHVLLLRDPEFRAAEAEADAELETMDGQAPTRRVAGAR